MSRWTRSIVALSFCLVSGCGGQRLADTGGADDEILFINDTPDHTYRITVVGTTADFTLRGGTRKAVRVPVAEDVEIFNINIERTRGEIGEARYTQVAQAGDTVRIFIVVSPPPNSVEDVVIEVETRGAV